MGEDVTIWYRGERFQLGRWQHGYGLWAAGEPQAPPLGQWPENAAGWAAAWARFTAEENPGTIVHLSPAGPAGQASQASLAGQASPAGQASLPGASQTDPVSAAGPASSASPAAAVSAVTPAAGVSPVTPMAGVSPGGPAGPVPGAATASVTPSTAIPVILIALGVVAGIVGLFPHYLSGQSLTQIPASLLPHVFYLAAWALSAVLLLSRGTAGRVGALFGLGASIVACGFFLADIGSVMSGGLHMLGPGLILALDGWLVCALGTVLAVRIRPAGRPGRPGSSGTPIAARPVVTVVTAGVAALGTAIAFAPPWDSYTLRTPSGVAQTVTAGNAFANPAGVVAGNVVVMIAVVVVAVAAGLWRPPRLGAALLAGAAVPMVAQVVSALVQIAEGISPAAFGISPSQAARAGLTISSGLTAAFWIYCAFLAIMLAVGAWMMFPARPVSRLAPMAGPLPWGPPPGAAGPPAGWPAGSPSGAPAGSAAAPGASAGPAAAPGAPTLHS